MNSLTEYLKTIRENFTYYEGEARQMLAKIKEQLNLDEFEINYKREQRRLIKRKLLPGERNTECSPTPQQKFNTQVYLVIVDSLIVEVEKRSSCYQIFQFCSISTIKVYWIKEIEQGIINKSILMI